MCNGSHKGETQVSNNSKTRAFQTKLDRSILSGKMQGKKGKKKPKPNFSSIQFNKDNAKLFNAGVVIFMPSSV